MDGPTNNKQTDSCFYNNVSMKAALIFFYSGPKYFSRETKSMTIVTSYPSSMRYSTGVQKGC